MNDQHINKISTIHTFVHVSVQRECLPTTEISELLRILNKSEQIDPAEIEILECCIFVVEKLAPTLD